MKKDETSSQGGDNQGGTATQTDPNPTGASHTQANQEGKSPPADPKASGDPKANPRTTATNRKPPPNAYPQTSRQKAGVGRVLHAFSPAWDGPRSVNVCNCVTDRGALESGMPNIVNGNIAFDGSTEPKVLEHVRRRNSGNTFTNVEVFDALTPEQRLERMPSLAHGEDWRASWNGLTEPPVHFEWPALD